MYSTNDLMITFILLGISTFSMRSIFLLHFPRKLNNSIVRKGLESIPSALLVALVIPYALFIDGKFDLFSLELGAILLTIPLVKFLRTPGLSLFFGLAILLLFGSLIEFINI